MMILIYLNSIMLAKKPMVAGQANGARAGRQPPRAGKDARSTGPRARSAMYLK